METSSKKSMTIKALLLVTIIVGAFFVAYMAITYPRVIVSFPVSFTIGADVKRVEFEVPFLHSWIKVEVFVSSGTALWTAKILSNDTALWSHTASQSEQTTYSSEWIKISSGYYNFTITTVGIGSLEAEVRITSKGGFW